MSTEIMGQLPCPECGSNQDLKTDGRKHTLKCHDCGLLAYYQTKDAKARIEKRLREGTKTPQQSGQTVMLQLPNDVQETQRFTVSIQPMVEHLNSITEQSAANDEDGGDQQDKTQANTRQSAKQKDGGFFGFLETMFD